jgi:membrane associated rhomboid family serine protease
MIPIKDDNPQKTFPIMTILLILSNLAVFIYQFKLGSGLEAFIYRFGTIPWEISHLQESPNLSFQFRSTIPTILTLFTSMFIHGGILHLLGNMIYLWIFGDNIEALIGHFRFLFFFICCGLVATFSHVVAFRDSLYPMVGASGAISGILGAYFLKFPKARVHILIFLFFFIRIIRVPALIVLGFWFIIQVLSGLSSLGMKGGGGIAWFAHIGGFIAGSFLVFFFEKQKRMKNREKSYR